MCPYYLLVGISITNVSVLSIIHPQSDLVLMSHQIPDT